MAEEKKVESKVSAAPAHGAGKRRSAVQRAPRGGGRRRQQERERDEFDQVMIDLARVTRVMAGGKRMRFRACMAVGNRKGKVGWAVAKGADVSIAINKAVTKAKKNLITVRIVDGTIPHTIRIKFKSAQILLKPAKKGSGIKAGGAVRTVLELAGIENISGKILGSNNKINNVQAVFSALTNLKYGAKFEQADHEVQAGEEVVKSAKKETSKE